MEKKCEICGNQFTIKDKGWSRKYCYECSPSYSKEEGKSKTIIALRKAMKRQAVKIKGGKCERCGYNRCLSALQFHHKDPTQKDFSISKSGHCHSWQQVLNEIEKCELLCANCHAEEHEKSNACQFNSDI